MKTSATVTLLGVSAALVNCQLSQNSTNNAFICPPNANAFCAGTSLTQNFIIRCNNGVGTPGNCNDNLASIPPMGVKPNALCYESSPTAGDAACSLNGTVYAEGPNPHTFTVPLPSSTVSLGSTQHLPGLPPYTPPPSSTTASTSASVCSASSTTTTTTTTSAACVCSASSNATTTTTTVVAGIAGAGSTTTGPAPSGVASGVASVVTATSTAKTTAEGTDKGAGAAQSGSDSGSGSSSSTSPSTTTTALATSTGEAAVLKGNVAVAGGMVIAAGVFVAAFV